MASLAVIASGQRPEAIQRPRSPHLDYESFWTTEESQGWLNRALEQAASWLRGPSLGLDMDLTTDGEVRSLDGSKRAQVLHRTAGRSRGIRLKVWNSNGNVTYIVNVLAAEGVRDGWLQLTVTSTDRLALVEKPRLADQFIDVIDFSDVTPLRSKAAYTSYDGLEDLEALIGSPDRRLPVIVAAPLDNAPFDVWNRLVNQWTQKTVGIAHVASLAPLAAGEFTKRHGTLAVPSGTLRTYPAGADLHDPVTAITSRWLSHQSLAGDNKAVARTIERFVRQHTASQPMLFPAAAREWARAFDRIASSKLRAAASPTPRSFGERRELLAIRRQELHDARPVHENLPVEDAPTAVGPPNGLSAPLQVIESLQHDLATARATTEEVTRRLHEVQETLMLDDLTESTLNNLLDLATRDVPDQSAIDALVDSNESLQSRLDILDEELVLERAEKAEAQKELRQLESDHNRTLRETEYLRSKVLQSEPELAYAFADQEAPQNPLGDCPATWELLARSEDLAKHGIILTAPEKKVSQLEAIDADGSALTAAWDALGTLAAYRDASRSGAWDKDVHDYCESGPLDQFHVPPNKHSRGETSATKQDSRYRRYRLLPVPKSVDESEMVYMWAHFKPHTWAQNKRLRIHYYDQVSTDGKIYVGHLGEHLPSASTEKVHR